MERVVELCLLDTQLHFPSPALSEFQPCLVTHCSTTLPHAFIKIQY